MNLKSLYSLATAALTVLAACGGSADGIGTTGPTGGTTSGAHHITAKIDGGAFVSNAGVESFGVPTTLPGVYAITGSQIGGSTTYIMVITLYNVGGPGTYPLGVGPTTPGGNVLLSTATASWATPQSGADGTITITTLTSTHMTGTFSVTVAPFSGGATAAKVISDGDFDIELKPTGTIGPLPDKAGSKISATIAGASWNAASVAATYTTTNGIFVIASTNNTRGVGITLQGVTGPGTYIFSTTPTHQLVISSATGALSSIYASNGAGSSGSVVITSMTATRVKGTFSGTLGPAPGGSASGTLVVTGGSFDVGLP